MAEHEMANINFDILYVKALILAFLANFKMDFRSQGLADEQKLFRQLLYGI